MNGVISSEKIDRLCPKRETELFEIAEVNLLSHKSQEKILEKMNGAKEDKLTQSNGIHGATMSIENIRERMQTLQQNVVNQMDKELNEIMSEVMNGIENIACTQTIQNGTPKNIYSDKIKPTENGVLPEKHFQTRNSILTDLFAEVKHMKTVYNIFTALLIILFLNTAAHDLLDTGKLNLGISTIIAGFGNFTVVLQLWLSMTISSFCVYPVYSYWAQQRMKMLPKSVVLKVWDYSGLTAFIIYLISFIVIPAKAVFSVILPPPSCTIVIMEQIRMLMKIYAFVRSTAPSIINYKPHTEENEKPLPEFSKFLYFMFAPTIVYRNNYPRTKTIRWRFVAWNFFEVILVVFYTAFTFERFVIPVYKDFGLEPWNLRSFVLRTFSTTLPGIIIFFCGFYCLLHAWMNAWAELLRFGDKLFYKDWWNCTSYGDFYRTWNVVVHDWLYVYIYKDLYEIVMPKQKLFATFSVFFVSAIFHEYILFLSFRLFYPVMFGFFGVVGFLLVFIRYKNSTFGNIFLWFSLCTGSGMIVSFYAMEYFARINCPGLEDDIVDFFMPRSWFCYTSYNSTAPIN